MDTKPEANREVEADEFLEGETRTAKEEDKATKLEINYIKKDIGMHKRKTYKNRRRSWNDNPNDEQKKTYTDIQDSSENQSDKDSTWTEDESLQHKVTTPKPKQPILPTQRIQQTQVQPKTRPQIKFQDNEGIVGLLTGLQPSSGTQSPSLSAGLRLKETGSISANNMERTVSQINEVHEDNDEGQEDEQIVEAALIQDKEYRINVISKPPVYENLIIQPQNDQNLNAMSQMEKDDQGLAPVGVREKPKRGKGNVKTKIEGISVSNEPKLGRNVQIQTKTAFTVPKAKAMLKRGRNLPNRLNQNQKTLTMRMRGSRAPDRAGMLQSREISVEISLRNREEERVDEDGSSGDGGKDQRNDIQLEVQWNGRKDQKNYINMETDRGKKILQTLDFLIQKSQLISILSSSLQELLLDYDLVSSYFTLVVRDLSASLSRVLSKSKSAIAFIPLADENNLNRVVSFTDLAAQL
ncbi:MAG: hypothetical protein EZS28_002531 [Streblomastix strix]|uniref:Uncharacterized protein n=1 Tax=Streblomastix strix TaxID=222440 RepID=A0A5J4X557_9EUKA|nr:MAG: hypothetical protein EZS28_002531 [Streblomastix strix]